MKALAAGCLLLVTSGCTSFNYCHEMIKALEQTVDPIVYDYWEARVEYDQDWGGSTFGCSVAISASGYIGQKADLTHRPAYIDRVLK